MNINTNTIQDSSGEFVLPVFTGSWDGLRPVIAYHYLDGTGGYIASIGADDTGHIGHIIKRFGPSRTDCRTVQEALYWAEIEPLPATWREPCLVSARV